ncbi:MAG: hypothetical protein DWQ07_09260 [Chloroflexi bacterium]|nr:MAG: hypothetical protein DWQ07_09260 [Chloroflexota bacterium]MBL1193099.1 hypothetical protein [Chloroflexota bacterium]NOH10392.1 hypothetical protein [Chloroflexota bacterium]
MKAYAIIQQLRTATAGVSAAKAKRLLAEARDEFATLPPDEQAVAVGQVLEFVGIDKPSPTTMHNRLDHLVPLLERLEAVNLVIQLANVPLSVFENLPGTGKSAPLYRTLRSLWKFLAPIEPTPASLQFYGKSHITPKYLLGRDGYGRLLRGIHQHANSEDQIIWFYLASSLRLRTIELKNLSLKDVWLVHDHLTVFVLGKGEKRRQVSACIPTWMSKHIQNFIKTRTDATVSDPNAPFFNTTSVAEGNMRTVLKQTSVSISLHDLRRFQVNLGRANDEPLLDGIGKLGHSTSQTAMNSYVTVLPLLQAECLQATYLERWSKVFSHGLPVNSLARSMGISRQAVHNYKSQMTPGIGKLSLNDAIKVVILRIQNAKKSVHK